MRWLILDARGERVGDFAVAQDMAQPAYAGCTQVEVEDDDPRLAPPPPPPPKPSPLDWFMRLSPATQAALDTAARTDTAVSLALRYAGGVVAIDVTDPRTIQNVNLLRSKGLLTEGEVATLLAP